MIEFKDLERGEKADGELRVYEVIKASILDISNSNITNNGGRKWAFLGGHFTTYGVKLGQHAGIN